VAIELIDVIDPIGAINAIEAIGHIEALGPIDGIELIDVEAIDFINHIHDALEVLPRVLQHCTETSLFM